ncbi:MAG TPA: aldose epimerase family protein [Rhizomicrobium sp.]|nr:aldose epimerase family protein [Rhizomicrobium sp.]
MKAAAALLGGLLVLPVSGMAAEAAITRTQWGETPDHRKVDLYTLTNANGMTVRLSTYGAVIQGLEVPDRKGKMADIVRGFDSLAGYLDPANSHIGAVIGRYADDIKGARFTLEGATYHLYVNTAAGNTIHGGMAGFDKKVWQAEAHDGAAPSLTLRYTSPDGEEHFPGTLAVTVAYTLQADNALRLDYRATTDKVTVLNLTNHAYFNLKGHDQGDVLEHRLTVMADSVNLADENRLVTGAREPVKGTAFDFTAPMAIGKHIHDTDMQIASGPGYDQNFILRGKAGTLRPVARMEEPQSGRVMEVLTTQPSMQLYTANGATPVNGGKGGATYFQHGAFCLETQHYADAPNHPEFPSTVLKPGETFHEVTVFRFPKPGMTPR